MKTPNEKWIKVFLRLTIATAFLSAVADRFGVWPEQVSAWGNWQSFVDYTGVLLPWWPDQVVNACAVLATIAETLFGLLLLFGFQTKKVALLSGLLLLMFAIAMTVSLGIKAPLDYSVFTAAAAAFAISSIDSRWLEIG